MKKRNSIVTSNFNVCFLCGMRACHCHHIFFGVNRKWSEKFDIVVPLCYECHEGTQGVHRVRAKDLYLKAQGQKAFEAKYGHEEFMRIFGKNYL